MVGPPPSSLLLNCKSASIFGIQVVSKSYIPILDMMPSGIGNDSVITQSNIYFAKLPKTVPSVMTKTIGLGRS